MERSRPTVGELVTIGATSAGCVAVGVGGGLWLGSAARVGVVAVFVGLALGLIAAVTAAYFKIKRYL